MISPQYEVAPSEVAPQKQDHVGVAPLKSDDNLVTDAAGKADVLNRQFSSVFTQEQINTMPDKGASPYPNLPKITITRNGVEALLQKVKPKKASGPDLIPARFLHEIPDSTSLSVRRRTAVDHYVGPLATLAGGPT